MKGMGTIALREIVERRMLFLLALALGLLSVLLPVLPFVRASGTPQEVRDLLSWIFALAFSGGLAILLGASVVGRDLSEGRIGFYFARPVGGLALWAGKFAGAYLLVLGTGFLVMLPATLLGGGLLAPIIQVRPSYSMGLEKLEATAFYLLLAGALLFLIVASHALSVVIRSRSPWTFLDLLVLCTLALAALFIGRALLLRGAYFEWMRLCFWLAAGVLVALVAASAVQVCEGRTDVKRGHRVLSVALWSCTALCLALIGLRASWYLDVSPAKLKRLELDVPPQGNWVSVTGSVNDKDYFYASFLVDMRTGKTLDIGMQAWREATFSPDGSFVCWPSPTGWPWKPTWELVTMDLSAGRPQPRHTNIALDDSFIMPGLFSGSGERLAYATGENVSIVETKTLKSLGAFHLPIPKMGYWSVRGHFITPELLRLYVIAENENKTTHATGVTILEYDAASRTLTTTGHISDVSIPRISLSPANDRLLVSDRHTGASDVWDWAIYNARTGALLTRLTPSTNLPLTRVAFLSDGRLALAEEAGDRVMLHLLSPDGQPLKTLDLGEGTRPTLGGEPMRGCLALTVRPIEKAPANASPEEEGPRTILLVDLETGGIKREPKSSRVRLAYTLARWFNSDAACTLVPGSPSSRLFVGNNTLWEVDPATGTERLVFKAGQ